MPVWFTNLDPAVQALLATLFTWFVTALGASLALFFRRAGRAALDAMLGAAGGVMLAASYWSLLQPAIAQSADMGLNPLFSVLPGLIAGGAIIWLGDAIFHKDCDSGTHCSRMLVFSITLHNIPEGLAVGVAFGAAAYGLDGAELSAALMLALGIGLQNFPEGAAVSLPLCREGRSRRRAFFYGQLSGAVEPLAGVAGALLATGARRLLPFLMSLAAGAMIYVVIAELAPESQKGRAKNCAALFAMLGFAVMTAMDVTLG